LNAGTAPCERIYVLGGGVELGGGDPGADLALHERERLDQDRPGGGHLVDLGRRLLEDHAVSSRRSVESVARMWSRTSSVERVPSKRCSSPRSS
jgi:hypothetical protein